MRRVMWLLHWDEEQYCWFKYKCGLAYLHAYLPGDEYIIAQMERSAYYWSWWKNQWTLREELYLDEAEDLTKRSIDYRIASYRGIHEPKYLASEIHPNAAIMEESYMNMMQDLIKNSTK